MVAKSADHGESFRREFPIVHCHGTESIALKFQMEMHAVACSSFFQFGREGGKAAMPVGDTANQPPCQHQRVGALFNRQRKELDLELLGRFTCELNVVAADGADPAHFAMTVFDGPRDVLKQAQHFVEQFARLHEGCSGVISALSSRWIKR